MRAIAIANTWLVIGQLGSGKSTFAGKVAKKYDIKHVSLDDHIWDKGWKEVDDVELQKRVVAEVGDAQGYVVEGVLVKKLDKQFIQSFDKVVFLDVPFRICFLRARKRNFKRMIKH